MTDRYSVIIIESNEKDKNEIEKAIHSFIKILAANNSKARIAYQGSKKEVIKKIDNTVKDQ
jgi:hypothetical protein